MAAASLTYSPELHPKNWTKRSEDHPWLVASSSAHDEARKAGDARGELAISWALGSVVTRAAAEAMGVPIDVDASPIDWVEKCREVAKERQDRFPGKEPRGTMPPYLELSSLGEVMPWIHRLLASEEPTAEVKESPYNGVDHIWRVVVNCAYQLIGAMTPMKKKAKRKVPPDAMRQLFDFVVALLPERDVFTFMNKVIDACEDLIPGPWEAFRSLPYEESLHDEARHVERVTSTEPPKEPLKALWFGMFNPIRDGLTTADIYFGGATAFDPDDEDWMGDLSYDPKGGYFESRILSGIYDGAYRETDLENNAEYPLCLAYGAFLARTCTERYADQAGRQVWATAGFDSGDFIDLGWIGSGQRTIG